MDKLNQLRSKYLELTNRVLPQLAQQRQFPVRANHCFQRIILGNLCGCCWYEVWDRSAESAYKQLTAEQLERAIAMASAIVTQPDEYVQQLNQYSLL